MIRYKKIGRKYLLLSSRVGLTGGPFHGMEWMEDNYNDQTLRQLTENVGMMAFIYEMIDVLTFDVVNVEYLSLELGHFDIYERAYISNVCFNKNITQIKLFLEDKTQWSKSEINSMEIEFRSLLKIADLEVLILGLGFTKLLSDTNLITYVKHGIDVWLYQEKRPFMEITLKIENENIRFLKIEYKGQPFS